MHSRLRSALVALAVSGVAASANAQSYLAYAANRDSDNVSVVDVTSRAVTTTISLTGSPKGIAISPDGAFAYVVSTGAAHVWVIDVASQTVVGTVELGANAGEGNLQGIAITPDGAFAYIPRTNTHTVAVVDLTSRAVVDTIPIPQGEPTGIVIEPTGAFAYVGVRPPITPEELGLVAVIDTATRQVAAVVNLGFSYAGPTDLAVTPDGNTVYVATQDWYLKALDTQTNLLIATLNERGGDLFGVAVAPDGARVYVTEWFGPSVLVFDTATNGLVATVAMTSRPRDIAITPDGALALVTGELNTSTTGNDVTVVDLGTNAVVGSPIPVGTDPVAIAITPDTSPSGRLTRLIALTRTAVLGRGIDTSLLAKLTVALNALGAGETTAACGTLNAFAQQVGALKNTKIAPADVTHMRSGANDIRAALGCR